MPSLLEDTANNPPSMSDTRARRRWESVPRYYCPSCHEVRRIGSRMVGTAGFRVQPHRRNTAKGPADCPGGVPDPIEDRAP